MFNAQIGDIFSGYRAFTRAAVRQIPITARGFDVETELTLQALYRGLVIKEMPSRLSHPSRGQLFQAEHLQRRFSRAAAAFFDPKSYKPLTFFGGGSLCCWCWDWLAGARAGF